MHRRYSIHSQAWWAPANPLPKDVIEQVGFGFYEDDAGCLGEAHVTWHNLGRSLPAPRLEAFDDAWLMLGTLADEGFFNRLRELDGVNIAPTEFREILHAFGFNDATPREQPTDGEPVVRCLSCGQKVRR